MKKNLLVVFGLMMSTCLVACQTNPIVDENSMPVDNDNQVVDENNVNIEDGEVVDGEGNVENEGVLLTVADLEQIDAALFPVSYSYETYNLADNTMITAGEYIYPEDIDHGLLIPEHATMVDREVLDSSMVDGMIYTYTNITLQDGTVKSVLYINNPDTLQYIVASVNDETTSTLYTFVY